MRTLLTPEKGLIFRIVHIANVKWILANGVHCANSAYEDPDFVPIGNPDLISKRSQHPLPPPGIGTLSDYVPFYFTPLSPMMLNIKTGYNGITQRINDEIVVLVSSFEKLQDCGVRYIFSDRHALLQAANFFDDIADLDRVDWAILQNRDFKRDPDDPGKMERYMAEALAYEYVPVRALLGIAVNGAQSLRRIQADMAATGVTIPTAVRPRYYF